MGNSSKIVIRFAPVVGGNHNILTTNYIPIGDPFIFPVVSLVICSSYNRSVFLSLDGIHDHLFIIRRSVVDNILTSNKTMDARLQISKGNRFYIKQGPDGRSSSGDIFISCLYEG